MNCCENSWLGSYAQYVSSTGDTAVTARRDRFAHTFTVMMCLWNSLALHLPRS